jgi:hypothetical protein
MQNLVGDGPTIIANWNSCQLSILKSVQILAPAMAAMRLDCLEALFASPVDPCSFKQTVPLGGFGSSRHLLQRGIAKSMGSILMMVHGYDDS